MFSTHTRHCGFSSGSIELKFSRFSLVEATPVPFTTGGGGDDDDDVVVP
jgi:hypothetical protein